MRNAEASIHPGMAFIPSAEFLMGSDHHYPEERPVCLARVDDFWIDVTPVTNRDFGRFVAETGYRTVAEIPPDPVAYPGLPPEMARAGSAVFMKPNAPIPPTDPGQWWAYVFGADWRHPYGPDSTVDPILDHPVVQVAYADALAYAKWAGKELPTEGEWEYAARGGLTGAAYAWGDDLEPAGETLANYWQGRFPWENKLADGYERTSPVAAFPPNGFGLYDLIGNVWEWTTDWFATMTSDAKTACCGPTRSRQAAEHESYDPAAPRARVGRKVLKGGSYLCAENYCRRFRPAARHPQPIDSPTSHIGFRCVMRR